MPIPILMPALSPTMAEGTIARWLKNEGDNVKSGDVLAEIETDKATMEVEAVDEGKLGRILVPGGTQNVAVNTPIAMLLEDGEDAAALDKAGPAGKAGGNGASPLAQQQEAKPDPAVAPRSGPVDAGHTAQQRAPGQRIFASPLAKRLAAQAGLDLASLRGTGPNGRIVKADIEAAVDARKAAPAAAPATPSAAPAALPQHAPAPQATPAAPVAATSPAGPPASPPAGPDARKLAEALGMAHTIIPNSGMRKTIAKRLTEAWQTIPHFALNVDLEIDRLLALRAELNERSGAKISVNDFVVKASALALRKVPEANVSWHPDGILQYADVDVSVAVATDAGLITPIVKKADQKGLATISADVKALAAKAKDGKLKPEEYQGGTFSVSNLGMFGIKSFTSIINPPQSCILSVGAGEKRPVVKDDALAMATIMSVTLTVDHRSVDGAVGARWLQAFKGLIEDPLSMML